MSSIITRFIDQVTDPQFKLARDLMAMAMADGEVTLKEIEAIKDICQIEGIEESHLMECLQGNYEHIRSELPRTDKDRKKYLANLILIIGADEYCAPQEIYLFQIIAGRLGLNQMHVISLFLTCTSHSFFKGDVGSKIMRSFLKNYIDPHHKLHKDNIKHIRMLYDMVAKFTERREDETEDYSLLKENLTRATNALLLNTILEKEFRDERINFEQLLRNEEKRALDRFSVGGLK